MVRRLRKLFRRRIKPEIEIGSDTGIEEELSKPARKIEERKEKKIFPLLGFKITLRW